MRKKYARSGPDIHKARKDAGKKANDTVMNSPSFKKACLKAGVEPTRRQARKFRMGKGLAHRFA